MRKIVFMILAGSLLLVACGGAGSSSSSENENATPEPVPGEYSGLTNPLGAESVTVGADVFRTNCEMCHGPQGHGDGPAGQSLEPRPGNLAQVQANVGDDYLYWRIREGKPGTSMVAWKNILTEAQIWQAVSFIRTLQ